MNATGITRAVSKASERKMRNVNLPVQRPPIVLEGEPSDVVPGPHICELGNLLIGNTDWGKSCEKNRVNLF
jgi:hypothetical protein